MTAVVREVGPAFDGPKVTCPHCGIEIGIEVEGARWTIRSPRDIADRLVLPLGHLEREELWVLVLDTKNHVIQAGCAYRGSVSASPVRVGELFREAIRLTGTNIIIVHNHPSGDSTPSPDDLHLTAEAIAAGRLLDIAVLDHLVIAGDGWTSLRDRGIAFDRPGRHEPIVTIGAAEHRA